MGAILKLRLHGIEKERAGSPPVLVYIITVYISGRALFSRKEYHHNRLVNSGDSQS